MHAPVLPVRWRRSAVFVFLFCAWLPPVSHAALYQCTHQGTLTFSDRPCEGVQRELAMPSAPAAGRAGASDYPAQLVREKAELTQLQNLREQRERQDQQIRDLTIRGQVAKQKKCRSLALQSKWKQEDVEQAPPKSKASATRKARRSMEKFQSECS